jgi:hypothetical protein
MLFKLKNIFISGILIILTAINLCAQQWQSTIVFYENDRLKYLSDNEGNKIPDFSYAGYKGGGVAIPDVPVVKTISPIDGDNTAHLQNAITEIASLPLNEEGFRGALLLSPGTYEIRGTLKIRDDGIVLRGSGDADDPTSNSILLGTGNSPNKRSILVAGGGLSTKWSNQVSGTKKNILTDTIFVGDREFEVEDASVFSVGDNIIIFHPSTDLWLQAIDYGGTYSDQPGAEPGVDVPWTPGAENIVFNRFITAINGNKITIDAPVFNTLIRELSQSYIYKYARTGVRANIGIENLRIDIQTAGGTDEDHAWQAIDLFQIEDAWIRNCTMLHFGQSAVRTNTATRITVENCNAIDPVSKIEGERRYNYQVYTASQQILFYKCHATNGRHHFVSNGTSYTSGCVFLDCTSQGAYTSSEGHRRWSTGLLYDNVIELDGPRPGVNPRLLGLYNRGYYGTSHGWSAAHSVAWNCDVAQGDLIVQKPPTAKNYAIGCFGKNITGNSPPAPFNEPLGFIEGSNQAGLHPRSLYLAQLEERLNLTSGSSEPISSPKKHGYYLNGNYPNPFNPETIISFSIPERSDILLTIFDLIGREVAVLVNDSLPAGTNEIRWNGKDNDGNEVSSGLYIYKIESAHGTLADKMLLIR